MIYLDGWATGGGIMNVLLLKMGLMDFNTTSDLLHHNKRTSDLFLPSLMPHKKIKKRITPLLSH